MNESVEISYEEWSNLLKSGKVLRGGFEFTAYCGIHTYAYDLDINGQKVIASWWSGWDGHPEITHYGKRIEEKLPLQYGDGI
jgi:hypothetical protein